jgi:hypothetical protein
MYAGEETSVENAKKFHFGVGSIFLTDNSIHNHSSK